MANDNNELIRSAVCRIISAGSPDNLTFKAVAHKSGLSESTVRSRASSAWKLLELFDAEIMEEFGKRRIIQKKELNVGGTAGDFFMRLHLPLPITRSMLVR